MVKKLPSFTIEVRGNSVTFKPEKDTNPWYRKHFDRRKDGLVCSEVMQDLDRISMNLSKDDGKGQRIGKYKPFFARTLMANPKSSQRKKKTPYKKLLVEQLAKNATYLARFKEMKEILVYIIVYFRRERFEREDIDNHIKTAIDALKPYIGDDKKVVTLIAEKKALGNYPSEDMDFLEQTLLVLTEPAAKVDIMKTNVNSY